MSSRSTGKPRCRPTCGWRGASGRTCAGSTIEYSTRYRARLEATREFSVLDHTVVPYINYEWFFDTRYDAWTRTLAQAGAEVTFGKHFRFEAYLASQKDEQPHDESLIALGLLAKWYY